MEYQVKSLKDYDSHNIRYTVNEIKDKIYNRLDVEVKLDKQEVVDLINIIINEDTGIDLKYYDILTGFFEDNNLVLLIDEDEELTASEKKYIKKNLEKQYGKEIYKDAIKPVITQKLNLEGYSLHRDENYNIYMKIVIPFENFNIKTEICKYLFLI